MEVEYLHKLDDSALLQRFQERRERTCMAVLFDRYKHLVKGVAMKYLKNPADADDMVAHVFNKLLHKLEDKDVLNFKKYLYGTVRNECMAQQRAVQRVRKNDEAWQYVEKYSNQFMENEGFLHLSNVRPVEELVPEVLPQLADEQRQCIELFFFEGNSYEQISQITGYAQKSVKSYLQNGKRNLKKLLESHPDFQI